MNMSQQGRPEETINPFASPASSITHVEIDTSNEPMIAELRAFVGPNANYYLKRWAPLLQGARRSKTGNVAAFFLSGFWLPYRKMYKATLLFYGFIVAESIAESVGISMLGEPGVPVALSRVVGLTIAAICGVFGNGWYLSHAQKIISQTRAEGFEGDELRQKLSKRGGTNLAASLGLFALFVVLFAALSAFLEVV